MFEIMFNSYVEPIAEKIVESKLAKGGHIIDREKEIEKETKKIVHDLELERRNLTEDFNEGFQLISESLLNQLSNDELEKIANELINASRIMAENGGIIPQVNDDRETLQDSLKISDETMLAFYDIGFNSFEEKNFDNARKVFKIITFLNPFIYDYWVSLGTAEHRCQNYEQALVDYAFASLLDEHLPESHYYSSKVYFEMGDIEDAKIECEELEKIVYASHLESEWKKRIDNHKKILYQGG